MSILSSWYNTPKGKQEDKLWKFLIFAISLFFAKNMRHSLHERTMLKSSGLTDYSD